MFLVKYNWQLPEANFQSRVISKHVRIAPVNETCARPCVLISSRAARETCVCIMVKPPLSASHNTPVCNYQPSAQQYDHFPMRDLHRPLRKQLAGPTDAASRSIRKTNRRASFYWSLITVLPCLRKSENSISNASCNSESGWVLLWSLFVLHYMLTALSVVVLRVVTPYGRKLSLFTFK
jgi:hypothetical protein